MSLEFESSLRTSHSWKTKKGTEARIETWFKVFNTVVSKLYYIKEVVVEANQMFHKLPTSSKVWTSVSSHRIHS